MAITPAVSGLTPRFYKRSAARQVPEKVETSNVPSTGLSEHVIVAGSGRVGRTVADALSHLGLPCAVIELDDRRVQQARIAGLPVIYGDAGHAAVLEAADIARARAIIVTVPTFSDVRAIVETVKKLRPDLPIVGRADGPDVVRGLYALGIEEVTSPELEAAIEMTRQALTYLKIPAQEILRVASAMRREGYDRRAET